MINFVAYFSTAEDQLGYVLLDGHGTAPAEFSGGPVLGPGTYRYNGADLVLVEGAAGEQAPKAEPSAIASVANVWP